jgi:hypothetical protein
MKQRMHLLLSILVLTACAGSSADVVKTFELANPAGAPFSRILVVGAHPDSAIRREFEEALAHSLRAVRTDAVASIGLMNAQTKLNQETVAAAAETAGADAVLVSRPQDVQWSAVESDTRTTTEVQRKEADNLLDYFRYDYIEYEDPMSVTAVRTVVISSDLYRVSDRARIWSVESTAVEKENAMDLIEGIAVSTRAELQRDGLIR